MKNLIQTLKTELETKSYAVGAGQKPSVDAQWLVDTLDSWLALSFADNPNAVEAAIRAEQAAATKYTLMDIRQGPGEGNYDRIEELQICDAIRAAESVGELDEQDTLVMKEEVGEDEGET